MQYKPSEAAKACNTSVNTIRNWCRVYAAFLSPGAAGEGGQRTLTRKDLTTLQYIAQLRAENLQYPAIAQRLQETSIGDVESLVTVQPPPMPSTAITAGLQQSPEYFAMVESRFEALETARRNDQTKIETLNFRIIIAAVLGVCAGGILFILYVQVAQLLGGR